MAQVLKRALPFILAFVFGVMMTAIIGRLHPIRHTMSFQGRGHRCHKSVNVYEIKRITIDSVPDADFPDALQKSGSDGGSVRLIATFDADGSVKLIRPYPMLPFGVNESAAGSGEFEDVTPFMSDGRFVNSLPSGLTELAIEQVSGIKYKPRTENGTPVSQRVFVLTDYANTDSPFSAGCSSIHVTVMDETGILWQGNTWVSRNQGCVVI